MSSSGGDGKSRKIFVSLVKDQHHGIGLTITARGTKSDGSPGNGIHVRSILPGGPAAIDGRMETGDRIVAINGHDVRHANHAKAVELIHDSPDIVHLVVSKGSLAPDSHADAPSISDVIPRQHRGGSTSPAVFDGDIINIPAPPEFSLGRSSLDSSDLELEDVIPPEALRRNFVSGDQRSASDKGVAEMTLGYRSGNGRLSPDWEKSSVRSYLSRNGQQSPDVEIDTNLENHRNRESHLSRSSDTGGNADNGRKTQGYPFSSSRKNGELQSPQSRDDDCNDGAAKSRSRTDDIDLKYGNDEALLKTLHRNSGGNSDDWSGVGDVYEVMFTKNGNSLGLNILVSVQLAASFYFVGIVCFLCVKIY